MKLSLAIVNEVADAGWLYFYNFKGVKAMYKGMEVLYLDTANAGFAKELPILDFFRKIGITSLNAQQFKTAFLA